MNKESIEATVTQIIAEVLRREEVAIDDDFLRLGGDSIRAMMVVGRLLEAFRHSPMGTLEFEGKLINTIFDHRTAAALVSVVQESYQALGARQAPSIQPVERSDLLPLSFAQTRLWLPSQFAPENPNYNIAVAWQLAGPLNAIALQSTINDIVQRHEVLRTNFETVEGIPVQRIKAKQTIPVKLIDLSDKGEAGRWQEARNFIYEAARRPFNLSTDILLRITLLRLEQQKHIIILTMHHIISDGWSMSVLFHEISISYSAFVKGETLPVSPLSIQYADFAVLQREWLQGEVLEYYLEYWRRKLHGQLPVLELPYKQQRPPVQTFKGASYAFALDEELRDSIYSLAEHMHVSPFMVLLAAFKALLCRYTGTYDVIVGSPIANRTRPELEQLIGFFANTLVLRTDLSGDPTFRDIVQRVRRTSTEAYAHQDIPFEKIVEDLRPVRDLSWTPVLQVMFIFQNTPHSSLELLGLEVESIEIDNGTAKFDLTLEINDNFSNLSCKLEYQTDLFDAYTIQTMAIHLRTLLKSIVKNSDQRLSKLPILTSDESELLLRRWNDTHIPYPEQNSIVQSFESQVSKTPGAVAFFFKNQQLTYDELNRRANQVAHYLKSHGMEAGHLVGVFMPRSFDAIVAILGVLKAGGAYVPLEPDHPQTRLTKIIEDSRTRFVLTHRSLANRLPLDKVHPIFMDTTIASLDDQNLANPLSEIHSDMPAYLIYTSGSTGGPKGVIGLHRGALNRMSWMWSQFPFDPHEVCCQRTPLTFVDSVWEIFGPLLRGVPTVIIPDDVVRDTMRLVRLLEEYKITRVVLVPSLLRAVLETLISSGISLPDLKFWVSSGEELTADIVRAFQKTLPGRTLLNLYGASEVSADATWHIVSEEDNQRIPIGRPIANTQVYVLDKYQNLLPIGAAGELYIGGAGLANGYLNLHEETAERFIVDPFSDKPGARLFRSGDLVRYRPDGVLQLLGRTDQQVKIRGYRVEPTEVRNALEKHPLVRECAVTVREQPSGEKRLVAYIVSQRAQPTPSELRYFLRNELPEYMVPTSVEFLDRLPLTHNGKIDSDALPNSFQPAIKQGPRNEIERTIAAVWQDLLGVGHTDIYTDFFELGGDSMSANRLVARLNNIYKIELSLLEFYRVPTLASLAELILDQQINYIDEKVLRGLLTQVNQLTPEQVRQGLEEE